MTNLDTVLVTAFGLCASVVAFAYLGYAIFVWLLSRCFGRNPAPLAVDTADLPTVSLLVAAHNEEEEMDERIQNALALRYPPDKLEVVIASDGSTDTTDEIVRRYADRGVRLFAFAVNRGKAA